MGKVTLIGGGPYDSSYLTIQAKEALENADVVLYDHLLDEELLYLTKGECIYVGKAKGHHSVPQEKINALLVEKAKQYDHVVRLKGGDSFVFGRGGEEAMELKKHGISCAFIPGVSSVIAASEMAGIPLTYRGISKGFLVLSAHLKDHSLGFTKEELKQEDITYVILMGLTRVKEICTMFLEAGRTPDTPIAIISKGCSPNQRVLCATLATLPDQLVKAPLSSPGMIVVGNVVTLRKDLSFFEQTPLFGKHLLVTKVQEEGSPLTTLLKQAGAAVTEVQLGQITPCAFTLAESFFTTPQLLIFTSRNAIQAFLEAYITQYDIRTLQLHEFLVMGEKTAKVLRRYGIKELAHANGMRTQLLALIQHYQDLGYALLYCKGNSASSLMMDGKQIRELVVYENQFLHSHPLSGPYDAILFTCATSVERYPDALEETCCISIGPTTTKALQKRHVNNIIEAETPSYEAMVTALKAALH